MNYSTMYVLAFVLATAAADERVIENPVDLGTAENYVILTKSGITNVATSVIKGDIATGPISTAAITGFDLAEDSSGTFWTSSQVTGNCYGADNVAPTPSRLTTAVGNMETAYTDAASRATSSALTLNVKEGHIGGTTFTAGVYTWGSDVDIADEIILKGNKDSVFIFQSTGNVIVASTVIVDDSVGVTLEALTSIEGGDDTRPLASNVFWQLAGYLSAGTNSRLEGIFLVKTAAEFKSGSSLNGRVLAQTACTLIENTITAPEA